MISACLGGELVAGVGMLSPWLMILSRIRCGSGSNRCCRRRGRPRLHQILLAELRRNGLLDLDDMSVDGSHVRALKGGIMSAHPRSTVAALARSTT